MRRVDCINSSVMDPLRRDIHDMSRFADFGTGRNTTSSRVETTTWQDLRDVACTRCTLRCEVLRWECPSCRDVALCVACVGDEGDSLVCPTCEGRTFIVKAADIGAVSKIDEVYTEETLRAALPLNGDHGLRLSATNYKILLTHFRRDVVVSDLFTEVRPREGTLPDEAYVRWALAFGHPFKFTASNPDALRAAVQEKVGSLTMELRDWPNDRVMPRAVTDAFIDGIPEPLKARWHGSQGGDMSMLRGWAFPSDLGPKVYAGGHGTNVHVDKADAMNYMVEGGAKWYFFRDVRALQAVTAQPTPDSRARQCGRYAYPRVERNLTSCAPSYTHVSSCTQALEGIEGAPRPIGLSDWADVDLYGKGMKKKLKQIKDLVPRDSIMEMTQGPGDVVVVPSGVPHAVENTSRRNCVKVRAPYTSPTPHPHRPGGMIPHADIRIVPADARAQVALDFVSPEGWLKTEQLAMARRKAYLGGGGKDPALEGDLPQVLQVYAFLCRAAAGLSPDG